MQCTCLQCGATFHHPPSHVKRGGGKYCSRSCSNAAHRGVCFVGDGVARPARGLDHTKLLARKKRERERNRDKYHARHKLYRETNKQHVAERNRKWRLTHPEAAKTGMARFHESNPEWYTATKRAEACNRRAKEMGAQGHISRADITALWERQPVCVECGVGRGVDHIVEFWQGGANVPENLQNLCRFCNVRKTARLRFHPDR